MSRIDARTAWNGEHPDSDLLADLAARVLPDGVAAPVQAHVDGCAACSGRLADAERVRMLLRQDDPGPIPDGVLLRIEAALATAVRQQAEAAWRRGAADWAPDGAAALVVERAPDVAPDVTPDLTPDLTGPTPAEALAPAALGPSAAQGAHPAQPPDDAIPPPTRLADRVPRAGARPRRRPARHWSLPTGRAIRIAATVVAVGAVGSVAWLSAVRPGGGTATSAGGSAASSAVAPVLATGTNYGSATLARQARALIGNTPPQALRAESDTSAGGSVGQQPTRPNPVPLSEPSAGTPFSAPKGSESASESGNSQALRSPAALHACLSALGLGTAEPVAVDLARFQGREAAVIVVPARNGGYEVWVVPRTCAPSAAGALAHTVLPAP